MARLKIRSLLIAVLFLLLSGAAHAADEGIALSAGNLPLAFIPGDSRFEARGMGGQMWFESSGVTLALPDDEKINVVKIAFDGANADSTLSGDNLLPGKVNIFRGNDPANWRANIATYGTLRYDDLYPGVDLRYDGTDGALKSTFIANPGADWTQIRWRYDGAQNLTLDANDLKITLPTGKILTEHAPIAWQVIAGAEVPVDVAFRLGDDDVSFNVGDYDPTYPLILDPTISYSTYLGGGITDVASDVAADDEGNAYITGATNSLNFPISPGVYDTTYNNGDSFVSKINTNASGQASLVWSTFLTGGSTHLTVDNDSNVYIAGYGSNSIPVTVSAFQSTGSISDGFLIKLSPDGATILYATYVGGSGADDAHNVAVDAAANAYVVGNTTSDNFPVTASAYQSTRASADASDIFLFRIDTNASGAASLVYSTYLGGNGQDSGHDVAVDDAGNAYLTGRTRSTNFPLVGSYQIMMRGLSDAYLSKINTNASGAASLVYSTYFGGSVNTGGTASSENNAWRGSVEADSLGNAYIAGDTESVDLPVLNGFQSTFGGNNTQPDAFVAHFDTALSGINSLRYSTYVGGSQFDISRDLALAGNGIVYLAGESESGNFPLKNPIHPLNAGYGYVYTTKINTRQTGNNSLIFSTFLFLQSINMNVYGLADDGEANVYLVGGVSTNPGFPTTNGYQTLHAGDSDAYLTKLEFNADLVLSTPSPSSVALTGTNLILNSTITNNGNDTATGLTFTQTFPASFNFVSASSPQGSCSYNANVVTCEVNPLDKNAAAEITTVMQPQSAVDDAAITSIIDGLEADPNSANNTVVNTIDIVEFTDYIPTLTAPTDQSSMTNLRPAFTWDAVPGAASYEFQLGQSDPPTNTFTTTDPAYTPPGNLVPGLYHWRVRAVNNASERTQWSDTRTLTITSANNASPQRNLFISADRQVTLTWNPLTGLTDYDYQISTHANLSAPILDDTVNGLSVTVTLPSYGVYYWRVRGQNGKWSAIQSFALAAP